MPLGDVIASRCRIRTTQGTGEAVVFCMPQGGVAIRSPGPATYTCEIQLPATAALFRRLPLVPALVTRVDLMLPADVRPIVVGELPPRRSSSHHKNLADHGELSVDRWDQQACCR